MVVLQSISFANYALTTKTTNIIYGSAPYLTFDGGRTRVTNTEALLGISLSDGRTFTPTTNDSWRNPIELPVAGQSFNDIGILIPKDTNSIALSSLIGTPYNYWGDDDGDGQGVNGVTATGSLNLSIVDKDNNRVARNEVPTMCKAPYKLTLSNDEGRLTTRYGVPNESRFTAGNVTYYINPKETQICFAKPILLLAIYGAPYSDLFTPGILEDRNKGFITQSFTPSSYGLNFPTTGAHNLYFDLIFAGTNQALSWAPVSHGGIKATMTNSTSTSVRVTLTGPVATRSQWFLGNPGEIAKPSLPQVFELVGRDSSGNAVVKYGFELKQWFVNRGNYKGNRSNMSSWCYRIGYYRLVDVYDLTNASCQGYGSGPDCRGAVGATPSSRDNYARRHIGAGFFSEWGPIKNYNGANFFGEVYWTSDNYTVYKSYVISVLNGQVSVLDNNMYSSGVCVYP